MNLHKKLLIVLFFLMPVFLFCQEPYAEIVHQELYNNGTVNKSYTLVGDFDQDGQKEVVAKFGHGKKSYLKFYQAKGDEYEMYRLEFPPIESKINSMKYDSTENVIYIAEKHQISKYDPITNKAEVVFSTYFTIGNFKVYNIDSVTYFMFSSSNHLVLYDDQGILLFNESYSELYDFDIGNVDDDDKLEIVISREEKSKVLDFETFQEEWVYFLSFGRKILLIDHDNDGISRLYGYNYKQLNCIDLKIHSPIWTLDTPELVNGNLISARNKDSNEDILLCVSEFGFSARSLTNGEELWKISNTKYQNELIDLIDLNNDNVQDLLFGFGEQIFIQDIETMAVWETKLESEHMVIDVVDKMDDSKTDYLTCIPESGKLGNLEIQLHDGVTDSILYSVIDKQTSLDINSISSLKVGEDFYYLASSDDGIMQLYKNVFSYHFSRFLIEKKLYDTQLIFLEEKGLPFVAGRNGEGQFELFSIVSTEIENIWTSPKVSDLYRSYEIGNFDSDLSKEVAILYHTKIQIYDLETFELEKEIPIEADQQHVAIEVYDFDQDGKLDFIFGGKYDLGKTTISIMDIESGTVSNIPILDIEAPIFCIEIINLDSSKTPEIIILSDKFYIYDIANDSILSEMDVFDHSSPYNSNKNFKDIVVQDLDLDNHMDILIAHMNGYSRIKVNKSFTDIQLPVVDAITPVSNQFKYPIDLPVEVLFSEKIDESSLSSIIVKDAQGVTQDFSVQLGEDLESIVIKPISGWTNNSEIQVILPSSINDLLGNPLDGNKNGISDMNDDFTFTFKIADDLDNYLPFFTEINTILNIYPGQKIDVDGVVSDSNSCSSIIQEIKYLLDDPEVLDKGTSIQSSDGVFDSVVERFNISLSSTNLSPGTHKLYFLVKDAVQNWSQLDSIEFKVLAENSTNWRLFGCNIYNTFCSPASDFNYPFDLAWHFNQGDNSSHFFSKSIVAEDKIIYTNENNVYARDLESGDLLWEYSFEDTDDLSTPAYAYGNIYVQSAKGWKSKLVCLSLESGDITWSVQNRIHPYRISDICPVVTEGDVIIVQGSSNSEIASYDAFTGAFNWKRSVGFSYFNRWYPIVYKDVLYEYSKQFTAIDFEESDKLFVKSDDVFKQIDTHNAVTNPVIDTLNNQIVISNSKNIVAVNLNDYSVNWSLSFEGFENIYGTPALSKNSFFVGTRYRFIEIDAKTGDIVWESDEYTECRSTVVSDSIIAFCDVKNMMVLDRETKEFQGGFHKTGNLSLSGSYLIMTTFIEEELYVFKNTTEVFSISAEINVVDSLDCFGDENAKIEVNATGGNGELSYEWEDTNSDSNVREGLGVGIYTVTITDPFLNSLTKTIELTQPEELLIDYSSMDAIEGENNGWIKVIPSGGTKPYQFIWNDFPDVSLDSIYNLKPGTYKLNVIDANDCSSNVSIKIKSLTDIKTIDENEIILYPSVNSGNFVVQLSEQWKGGKYTIVNSIGNVFVSNGKIEQEKMLIDSVLPKGSYILRLVKDQRIKSIKFLVI